MRWQFGPRWWVALFGAMPSWLNEPENRPSNARWKWYKVHNLNNSSSKKMNDIGNSNHKRYLTLDTYELNDIEQYSGNYNGFRLSHYRDCQISDPRQTSCKCSRATNPYFNSPTNGLHESKSLLTSRDSMNGAKAPSKPYRLWRPRAG